MHGMMSVRVGDSERAVSLPSRRALRCASDHGLNAEQDRRAPRRAPFTSRSDSAATFTNRLSDHNSERLEPATSGARMRAHETMERELVWILSQGHAGGDEKHARHMNSARHEGYPTLGTRSFVREGTPHSDRYPPRPGDRGVDAFVRERRKRRRPRSMPPMLAARSRIAHRAATMLTRCCTRRRATTDPRRQGGQRRREAARAAPPPQRPTTYAERGARARGGARGRGAEARGASGEGRDLAVPAVRMGREPTVQNTRGAASRSDRLGCEGVGVDDETAAAIEKGASELGAAKGREGRGGDGNLARQILARYGLDKTAGR